MNKLKVKMKPQKKKKNRQKKSQANMNLVVKNNKHLSNISKKNGMIYKFLLSIF